MNIVFKGTLDNGNYVAMTAKEFTDHKAKEYNIKLIRKLEKLANNPALSDDTKQLLWQVRCKCFSAEMWNNAYIQLLDKTEKHKGSN